MTKITVRSEHFHINYKQEKLPALFKKQKADCDFSRVLSVLSSDDLIKKIQKARLTLLIACEQLKEPTVLKVLQGKADTGIRIYVLLGSADKNQAAIDMLSGRCLIRTGVSQQGALLLIDHTTFDAEGMLLMTGHPFIDRDKASRHIPLEKGQIEDSYRSFCRLFWEVAEFEYLQHNQRQGAVKHPDGEVVINHSHQLKGTLQGCLVDTLKQLSGASRSDFDVANPPQRLLLESASKKITAKARQGVVLSETYIPSLLFSPEGNWLLPDEIDLTSSNWCLKLSDHQSRQMLQAYNQAMLDAAWQYQAKVIMGYMPAPQKIRFVDQPELIRTIEQTREVKLEHIDTNTMESFLAQSAQELAAGVIGWQRDQLAHGIDYSVTIHPPYCPDEAKKDELYKHWENAESNWQQQLTILEQQQKQIDQKQETIAERIKGFLRGFLLGQNQAVKKMSQEMESLKQWSVTIASPAERQLYKERLLKLHEDIRQREGETEQKLDEAKQQQQWEDKKSQFTTELQEAKRNTQTASDKLKELEKQRPLLQDEVAEAFVEAWKKAATSLNAKQLEGLTIAELKVEQFLPEVMPGDKEEIATLKQAAQDQYNQQKQQVLVDMNVEQALALKKTLKEDIWKKHYNSLHKALDNYTFGLEKIERDLGEVKKKRVNYQTAQEQAEQALKEHGDSFVYRPKKSNEALDRQLGLKNTTTNEIKFSWPSEELPINGIELRSYKQQRYIVVFEKEQIEQAKVDCERLKAKIVCDRRIVNA